MNEDCNSSSSELSNYSVSSGSLQQDSKKDIYNMFNETPTKTNGQHKLSSRTQSLGKTSKVKFALTDQQINQTVLKQRNINDKNCIDYSEDENDSLLEVDIIEQPFIETREPNPPDISVENKVLTESSSSVNDVSSHCSISEDNSKLKNTFPMFKTPPQPQVFSVHFLEYCITDYSYIFFQLISDCSNGLYFFIGK